MTRQRYDPAESAAPSSAASGWSKEPSRAMLSALPLALALLIALVKADRQSLSRFMSEDVTVLCQSASTIVRDTVSGRSLPPHPARSDIAKTKNILFATMHSYRPRVRHNLGQRCAPPHCAVQPPSTAIFAPVIADASSRHRKSASAATCSGITNCFCGVVARRTSLIT